MLYNLFCKKKKIFFVIQILFVSLHSEITYDIPLERQDQKASACRQRLRSTTAEARNDRTP